MTDGGSGQGPNLSYMLSPLKPRGPNPRCPIKGTKPMSRRPQLARIKEKKAQMRAAIFPEIDQNRVWDIRNKAKTKGFTPVPRTMPLIGAIMDALSGKGKPVSTTFLELWCRADEQGFQVMSKPHDVAFASGFITERGLTTWRERMRKLSELGFITAKPGASGDFHYVQIWNPYLVIKEHAQKSTPGFPERHYHVLVERVHEIGATDLADVAAE